MLGIATSVFSFSVLASGMRLGDAGFENRRSSQPRWETFEAVATSYIGPRKCIDTSRDLSSFPILQACDKSFAKPISATLKLCYEEFAKCEHLGDASKTVAAIEENLPEGYAHAFRNFDKSYKEASVVKGSDRRTCHQGLDEPVAIFVLGPSAAGKTFSTKLNLPSVLEANQLPANLCFTTIDGGIMRQVSLVWKEITQMPKACPNLPSIKDAHELFAADFSRKKKHKLFDELSKQKRNLIIPDTAPGCSLKSWQRRLVSGVWKSPCKAWDFYERLRDQGYKIIMTAVYSDKETCDARGERREQSEGKVFSGKQWKKSVQAIPKLFKEARENGNENTFFIFDNNEGPDSANYHPPQVFHSFNEPLLSFVRSGKASFEGHFAQTRLQALETVDESTTDEALEFNLDDLDDDDEDDEDLDENADEEVYEGID